MTQNMKETTEGGKRFITNLLLNSFKNEVQAFKKNVIGANSIPLKNGWDILMSIIGFYNFRTCIYKQSSPEVQGSSSTDCISNIRIWRWWTFFQNGFINPLCWRSWMLLWWNGNPTFWASIDILEYKILCSYNRVIKHSYRVQEQWIPKEWHQSKKIALEDITSYISKALMWWW